MDNYRSTLWYYVNQYLYSNLDAQVVPRYGWYPDVPDRRDLVLAHYPTDTDAGDSLVTPDTSTDILQVDLRKQCPPVYDDKGIGCSTVSALAALLEFHELRTRPTNGYEPSRLCWYYLIREMRGTQYVDTGASFREAFKVVNDEGVCVEIDWPFHPNNMKVPPEWQTYESEPRSRPLVYRRVPHTLEALKHCLTHDLPIAFGLSVYASFESSITCKTGHISLPACASDLMDCPTEVSNEDGDDGHLGGHALVLVGYDDTEQTFIVRNSLGTLWGANGYGFIPYSYVLNPLLARDFWVILGDKEAETTESPADVDDVSTAETTDSASKTGEVDDDAEEADNEDLIPPLFRTLFDRVGM